MLRLLLIPVLFASPTLASDQTCVILKHASTSRQIFVSGANWQYVSGDFPAGLSWKSNVTDRYVRKIKENGGKVVIVPQDLILKMRVSNVPSPSRNLQNDDDTSPEVYEPAKPPLRI